MNVKVHFWPWMYSSEPGSLLCELSPQGLDKTLLNLDNCSAAASSYPQAYGPSAVHCSKS